MKTVLLAAYLAISFLPRQTQSDKTALQPRLTAAFKAIDEYKVEAEKITNTNAKASADKKVNSAIYQLPAGIFICGLPSPTEARRNPARANVEGCSEIRSLFLQLASDIRMLSILTEQHQIAPNSEEVKKELTEAIEKFKEDRTWVVARIGAWKTPPTGPAAGGPGSSPA